MICLLLTIVAASATAPQVALISPGNNTRDIDGNVLFLFSAADDSNLTTCSLYTSASGTFSLEQTQTISKQSVQGNFTSLGYAPGLSFQWNVLCTDDSGNQSFAPSNRALKINSNPVFTLTSLPAVAEDSGAHTMNLSLYASDADGDSVGFAKTTACDSSIAAFSVYQGILTYTPQPDMSGSTWCKIAYTDSFVTLEKNLTLEVTPVNDAPELAIPSLTVVQGMSAQVNLSLYTSDAENDPITYAVLSENTAQVDCSVSGSILEIEAAAGFQGTAKCEIMASDGSATDIQNVTITSQPAVESISVAKADGQIKTDGTTIWVNTPITLTIVNSGNVPTTATVNIPVLKLAADPSKTISALSYSPSQSVSLAVGETKQITATAMGIPADKDLGTYSASMNVTYGASGIYTNTVSYVVAQATTSMTVAPASASHTTGGAFSGNFTIKNTGDVTITGIEISQLAFSGYNIVFTPANIASLVHNQEVTVSYSGTAPSGAGSKTGTVYIDSNQINKTFSLTVRPESKLKIVEVDAKVGSKTDDNLQDGATIDQEAKPGDKVELKINIENQFTDNDDEIKDIMVEVTVVDLEDLGDDDIEIDVDEFDLSGDRDTTKTVSFTVPYRVLEGSYEIRIHVEGEDEDDNVHEDDWTLNLEVEKDSSSVIISSFSIEDEELTCQRDTIIKVTATNIGSDTEDKVKLNIISSPLGLNEVKNFELDDDPEDDDSEQTFSFPISLEDDLPPGNYQIIIRLYVDNDKEDEESLFLNVKACTTGNGNDDDDDGTGDDDNGTGDDDGGFDVDGDDDTGSDYGYPPTSIKDSTGFMDSDLYIILLIVLNAVFVAVLIWLLVLFLAK